MARLQDYTEPDNSEPEADNSEPQRGSQRSHHAQIEYREGNSGFFEYTRADGSRYFLLMHPDGDIELTPGQWAFLRKIARKLGEIGGPKPVKREAIVDILLRAFAKQDTWSSADMDYWLAWYGYTNDKTIRAAERRLDIARIPEQNPDGTFAAWICTINLDKIEAYQRRRAERSSGGRRPNRRGSRGERGSG